MAKTALPKAVRAWFSQNGKHAGKLGGKARAAKLSKTQLQAIAREGGLARQAKARDARAMEW
jgi:hypothetical protein